MRWLRRSKVSTVPTDYRRVSDAVHARRAEHERDPAGLPSDSGEARRAVRSYRPNQRLGDVSEQIRGFVEHSAETPRTFGEDRVSTARRLIEPEAEGEAETVVKVFLTANLFVGAMLLTLRISGSRFVGDLLLVWCAVIACALQILVGLQCWERSRRLCVAGVSVGLVVFAFGCDFLVRFTR